MLFLLSVQKTTQPAKLPLGLGVSTEVSIISYNMTFMNIYVFRKEVFLMKCTFGHFCL